MTTGEGQIPLLRVPRTEGDRPHPLVESPRRARGWIGELPLADPARAGTEVLRALGESNRRPARPGDRLRFVLLLEPVLGDLGAALLRRLREGGGRDRLLALCGALHREAAVAYKHAILDHGRAGLLGRLSRGALALAHCGAVGHLAEVLVSACRAYHPCPAGLWLELNQLLLNAEGLAIAARRPDVPATLPPTPADGYRRAALLHLASPWQLSLEELQWVWALAGALAPRCLLLDERRADERDGLFMVDLLADAPPQPLPAPTQTLGPFQRLLDTRPLVGRLRQENGSLEALAGPLPTAREELLARLVRAWSSAARRGFSRSRSDQAMEIVLGLSAVHAALAPDDAPRGPSPHGIELDVLSEDRPRDPGEYLFDPEADDVWSRVYGLPAQARTDPAPRPAPPRPAPATARAVDESAGGYCFELTAGDRGGELRIGEVCALRREPAAVEWTIGMVRWVRREDDARTRFGVQLIAPSAVAATVRERSGEGARACRALLLPPLPALAQPASLVLPARLFRSGEHVTVDAGGEPVPARLGRRLEGGRLYARFELERGRGGGEAAPGRAVGD
ncbi:hypothetical protein [Inmirania thermothiophila]|uniref:Molecular chaperone n=1 Tax=Inmirania thermothiophila TaxID=1750597 RepID=A0A3N1Y8N9_9GAMM|nr:hypothetical protein [Inmirania thermothiophila]ROR35179.1 hypothetical protein EDC57_1096 [Inmirania thermothiophila]